MTALGMDSRLSVSRAEPPSLALLGCPARSPAHVMDWRTNNIPNLARGYERVMAARAQRIPHFYGQLWLRKRREDGQVIDYGLASMRMLTNAGIAFVVQGFLGEAELTTLQYHGIGGSDVPEQATDTDLIAEFGAAYPVTNLRAVGSSVEASPTTFRSVGNCQVAEEVSVREHGLFTAGGVGSGVLFDRSTFAPVPLVGGEAIQMTYDLVFSAGA